MTPQEALASALGNTGNCGHSSCPRDTSRHDDEARDLAAALTEAGMSIVPTTELDGLRAIREAATTWRTRRDEWTEHLDGKARHAYWAAMRALREALETQP